MEALAIIPAHAGSNGAPGKNVLLRRGNPLVAHSIASARGAAHVTRVVVSTDDDEIAEVALRHGAEVVRRPAALTSDAPMAEDMLLQVLADLDEREGYRPDLTVLLRCTSPSTVPEEIDGAIAALIAEDGDCAVAVTAFRSFLWTRDADGRAGGVNHDPSMRLMRQQREPEFLETGAIYVMRTAGFVASGQRFFGKVVLHETPIEPRLEIDEPADVMVTEERLAVSPMAALGRIRALAMDFDGVFTDDQVVVDQNGVEAVTCSRSDGMGIELLHKAGLPMVVISKETNPVVAARCRKLGLAHHYGIERKLGVLQDWLAQNGVDPADAAYVGNDVNDLECLRLVGCGVAPNDAHPEALAAATIVIDAPGGRGALRLLADLYLSQR